MSKFKVGDKVQLVSISDDNSRPGIVTRIDEEDHTGVYVFWAGNDGDVWNEDNELRWIGPADMTFQEVLAYLRELSPDSVLAYFLEQENISRKTLQDPDYQLYLQLHERYKGVNNG